MVILGGGGNLMSVRVHEKRAARHVDGLIYRSTIQKSRQFSVQKSR